VEPDAPAGGDAAVQRSLRPSRSGLGAFRRGGGAAVACPDIPDPVLWRRGAAAPPFSVALRHGSRRAMSTAARHLRRAAACLGASPVLVAALTAALPARAEAQMACPVAPVGTYYATGFACQLAGWRIYDLNFLNAGGPTPGGTAPSELGTILTPFTGTDARGRQTFGFEFTDFASGAAIVNGQTGDEFEGGSGLLTFSLSSLDPARRRLAGAGVTFALSASSATPGLLTLISDAEAEVFDTDLGGPLCLFVRQELRGPGSVSGSPEDDCALPLPTNLFAGANLSSFALRAAGGTAPITGATSAGIARLSFTIAPPQAIPEPSMVGLLAGGLLGLGALRARRRRG
jgi:hypothetical protein